MGFLCDLCGKEFSTKQNYTRHCTTFHQENTNPGNNRIVCVLCGKCYKRKENLEKHIANVHKPEKKEHYMRKCELCEKRVDRGSYKRHLILKHRPFIGKIEDKPQVNCSMCSAKFNSYSSLSYHRKKVHKIKLSSESLTVKCPLCSFITKKPTRTVMQTHFANSHNIRMEYKSCHFTSIPEFLAWKNKTERETTAKFIRAKTKSDVIMFKCHRSGRYRSVTNKRNLRTTGSCKINGFCPAFIKAKIVNVNDIYVTYQLNHVGHKNELHYISLTKAERKEIALQLAKKVPFDEILKKIRGTLPESPLQRIHLTSKKDIYNIKKAFDLNSIAIEHPFDLKTRESIYNIKTETHEQGIDQKAKEVEESCNKTENDVDKSFEYSPLVTENLFCAEAESGKVLVVRAEPVEYPAVQNTEEIISESDPVNINGVDYNTIEIQDTFDINTKEIGNTYDIVAETVEHTVDHNTENTFEVIAEDVNTNHVAEEVEYVYDFNSEVVGDSFNIDLEQVQYSSIGTEIIESVDDTKEAVENLLKVNMNEFKEFLDHESIAEWVENLRNSQNTSIAVYKQQGIFDSEFPRLGVEDFLLIYMTEAQKDIMMKENKDIVSVERVMFNNIQLCALLIPDETRDGFPIAFMFTNREDECLFIFFEKFKEAVGIFNPKALMTNIDEACYTTWMQVMGGNTLHLYCSRYLLQAWKVDINQIKLREKRNQVLKTLQSLLYELNESNFHNMLEECLTKWTQDKNTCEFFKYFRKLYVDDEQYNKWAYFFRVNAGVNTSICTDTFNRILKYCNIRGEKTSLADKTFCDVVNALRIKVFEQVIKINRGKVAKKLQNLRLRHGHSYTNDSEYVIQDEDKWQVYNYVGTEISEMYTVKKLKDCNNCLLRCHQCNSCFHEYVCSCTDHLIKTNMCKHIHLVARTQKLMENAQTENERGSEIPTHVDGKDNYNLNFNEIGVEQISDTDLPFAVRKRQFIEGLKKCLEESIESVEGLDYVKEHWQPILDTLKTQNFTR